MNIKMKLLVVIVLTVTPLAFSSLAIAEEEVDAKKYNVTINPIGLFFGTYNGSIDVGISNDITLGIGGAYLSVSNYSRTKTATGVGGDLRMTYYIDGAILTDGWYLSPLIEYVSANTFTGSASGAGFSGLAGYQWVYHSGFNMMLGGGLSYYAFNSNIGDLTIQSFSGFHPRVEFNLGFAF